MINADKLGNIKMRKPIVPTFESVTNGKTIVIEMTNGKVSEYHNEGYVELKGIYDSIQKAASIWYLTKDPIETFNECYNISKKYTEIIKKVYKGVKNVYIGDL